RQETRGVRRVRVLHIEGFAPTGEDQGRHQAQHLRDTLGQAHKSYAPRVGRSAGSEAELHHARQGPEVRIREPLKPERVGVARQAGHLRVVARVLREGDQVAPQHQHADAEYHPDADLLQEAAADTVTDVDLPDLHVRPVLDEEVDRVDAVV